MVFFGQKRSLCDLFWVKNPKTLTESEFLDFFGSFSKMTLFSVILEMALRCRFFLFKKIEIDFFEIFFHIGISKIMIFWPILGPSGGRPLKGLAEGL